MNHNLAFEWLTGCAADNMIRLFRELDIEYKRSMYGLRAAIGPDSEMVPVSYYRIEGNIFGIVQAPQMTSEYFGITPERLHADKGDGYTKEDCVLLDKSPDANPFCDTLLEALEKAEHYKEIGYDDIVVLQRLNSHYAVIAHG